MAVSSCQGGKDALTRRNSHEGRFGSGWGEGCGCPAQVRLSSWSGFRARQSQGQGVGWVGRACIYRLQSEKATTGSWWPSRVVLVGRAGDEGRVFPEAVADLDAVLVADQLPQRRRGAEAAGAQFQAHEG